MAEPSEFATTLPRGEKVTPIAGGGPAGAGVTIALLVPSWGDRLWITFLAATGSARRVESQGATVASQIVQPEVGGSSTIRTVKLRLIASARATCIPFTMASVAARIFWAWRHAAVPGAPSEWQPRW